LTMRMRTRASDAIIIFALRESLHPTSNKVDDQPNL
jgi:hypothetical protein